MRQEKWSLYINTLQGHPSVCHSTHTIESMKFITEYIPPKQFPKMLNIGAGEGLETKILSQLGYNVTGIIRGETNLDFAHKNYPDILYVDCDMHDLPFPSESFDAIYINHTFEHAFAPFIFLLEMYSVLKTKGRIWITMPEFKELTDPTITESNKLYHHHPNMLCYNLLKQMFESTGFKTLYSKKIDRNPCFDNPYLLEKQPLSTLHSDVRTAILKRKEIFEQVQEEPTKKIVENTKYKNTDIDNRNIFGDNISWEEEANRAIKEEPTNLFYNYNPTRELAMKLNKYKPKGKVLDCGCNIGRWIEYFTEAGYNYTGIDQSKYVIEKALSFHSEGNFICNFLWNLNFKEEFDIAFFNAVLQHNTLDEKIKIIPKIHKALKKDGILIIAESTVLKETPTQMTYHQWIYFIESFGFKFTESWHKNELNLDDNYLFIKT